MTNKTFTINPLSAPTWNRLNINDAKITLPEDIVYGVTKSDLPDNITAFDADFPSHIETGMGKDIDRIFRKAATKGYGTNSVSDTTLKLEYNGFDTACSEYFEIENDSNLNVIQYFRLSDSGNLLDRSAFNIGKNAKVTLTQIYRGIPSSRTIAAVGAVLAENASFHVIQVFLSGINYSGLQTELIGKESEFAADIAYETGNNEILDINYNIIHRGKQTKCDIKAAGTLSDHAEKLFRGTIDFQRGAAGSVGSEMEDVMLLSDDVINKTIPIILCKEEDVEGNHGATIGRIPDDLLFYLMSRGISEEEIAKMLARARLERVIKLIPDEQTRCNLL